MDKRMIFGSVVDGAMMSNIHKLKIAPEYFEAQKKGIKKFEIRKNDRDFKVGDLIELAEFKDGKFTDRTLLRKITYITDYAQEPGYVVFGTSPYRTETGGTK